MANLINIGSSSSGNSLVIEDGDCQVVLDLGFKYDKFRKKYREMTGEFIHGLGIDACLVTHRHKDHSRGLESFLESLADVYAPQSISDQHYDCKPVFPGETETTNAGDCCFVPFEVIHKDLAKNMQGAEKKQFGENMINIECYGYVIIFKKTENVWLYMTDTSFIMPPFDNINYAVMECNHDLELIPNDCDLHIQRSLESHLSVQDVCEILKNSNTEELRKIYFMHVSQSSLDVKKAYKMIKEVFKGEIKFCKKDGGFYEI